MYFSAKELEQSIASNDERIKNYYDTFGFVVIRKMIPNKDFKKLTKEYDRTYNERNNDKSSFYKLFNSLHLIGKKKFGIKEALKSFKSSGMRFMPNFVDESKVYSDYFFSDKYKKVFRYFAGENWLYLGSDGSNFITSSFPWHRDWFIKTPIMKFNFYYNPLPFIGGKFLLIPGSGRPDDSYSQLIQKCIAWPMVNKKAGGMAENFRLPDSKNPRDIFSIRNKLFKYKEIPHVEITLKKGDLILFDHRAMHCVQNNFPSFQRRLMTILISKNAYDFEKNHYSLKNNTKESLMREVIDLVVSERNHIGCEPWGKFIGPIQESNHYINIEKTIDSDKYNKGSFKTSKGICYESILDVEYYSKTGRAYREYFESISDVKSNTTDKEAEYSYDDVHLGINSQNIDKDIDTK